MLKKLVKEWSSFPYLINYLWAWSDFESDSFHNQDLTIIIISNQNLIYYISHYLLILFYILSIIL